MNFGLAEVTKVLLLVQMYLAMPIMLTSFLLGIIAPAFCLSAPREIRGTGYLLLSIIFNFLSIVFTGVSALVTIPSWLSFSSQLLPLGSAFFFILFLGLLIDYLEIPAMKKLIRGIFIFAIMCIVFRGLSTLPDSLTSFLLIIDPSGHIVSMVSNLVLPILILVFGVLALLRYLRLLEGTRRASLARSRD
jgi:hypothetical protein